ATILQGVHNNYDIDLFQSIIARIEDVLKVKAEGDKLASFRVIADHLRATAFLLADGVMPSNDGRGYVLRRIMRRAMRHANMLGATQPVLHKMLPAVSATMGAAYSELHESEAMAVTITEREEQRFGRTLSRGLTLLDEATQSLTEGDVLPGETAFKLYDTYGFPYDLTEDALRPRGLTIDRAGFDAAMDAQKAEARRNWQGSGEAADEKIWFAVRDKVGPTEFLGYQTLTADAAVAAIIVDGAEAELITAGQDAAIIFNQTPFYAEQGGQVGDQGTAQAGDTVFRITDVVKAADGLYAHKGVVEAGQIVPGDALTLAVDPERRARTCANHSATHILHECLRLALGDHVAQKGSLVSPDRLRFDFAHDTPMSADDIAGVEAAANDRVRENDTVDTRVMALEEAMESGARALFGEKYGDEVRVVSMGRRTDAAESGANTRFSVELCGGTHVARTGEIGVIALTDESAVSSGVRRIEALTGEAARAHLATERARLRAVAAALKVPPADAAERVAALMDERRRLERELEDAKKKLALAGPAQGDAARTVAGVTFVGRVVDGLPGKALKGLADEAREAAGSAVVAIVGRDEGRASVVVSVSGDLTDKFDAVALVRAGSAALGGKGGGGRRDMAQAGGPDAGKADDAIAAIATAMDAA
ncbi:MAG: alanine--tRNA ligase, partial [Pseudomonadota bacterium]